MTLEQAEATLAALRDAGASALRLASFGGELGWQIEANVNGLWLVLSEKKINEVLHAV